MLDHELYIRERLRSLEHERLTLLAERPAARRQAPVLGPAVRGAGRLLQRLGAALESRAERRPEPCLDCPEAAL